MTALLETPIGKWHIDNDAQMAAFAGWNMPIQYAGIIEEHKHTRENASVFDISHMGEFMVSGKNVAEALGKAVSHNFATLAVGKCRYGFLLNAEGKVIDDLIVYCLSPESYMLVVNGACVEGDFATIKDRLPADITLEDISPKTAKIDLQGPESLAVLEKCLNTSFKDLGYFAFRHVDFLGEQMLVSRTGYTGDLGYELYLPWGKALALWEKLLSDPKVKPAGLGSRDTLRLEAGLPLYGHELDLQHSPVEAGLGKMFTSEAEYVGKKGAQIIDEVLIPLTIPGKRSARNGDILALADGKEVGVIASGSFAPSLNHSIAFAWVRKEHAKHDDFVVITARAKLDAKKCDLPFYKQGTARRKVS